jgi:alkylated DNA repair dioxygenase AlkB
MDAFLSRKRRRSSPEIEDEPTTPGVDDEDDTDTKLATLASLHPFLDQAIIFEALLASDGSVQLASELLSTDLDTLSPRKKLHTSSVIGYQRSLTSFNITSNGASPVKTPLTKRGKTLHLYSPEDIAAHTPCSIIHNFLPPLEADALLLELLDETPTYSRDKFKLFDRVVESPHTFCFYADSWGEAEKQKTEYYYNGGRVSDIRPSLPHMLNTRAKVEVVVNTEIEKRIRDFGPNGKKLKFQDPGTWRPNAAFVNCYDGGQESVGYHSDQLTYLGPRAVIGSLSLGVAREFRVRKVISRDEESLKDSNGQPAKSWIKDKDLARADAEGQISIHLPHNSLLIMHASMQEEWKHSIAPAQAIDPHPLAKNKRLNITYRYYKANLHPNLTPRCKCNVPTVLRCVQRKKENRGRYMWMCHAGYTEGQEGCSFFQWAEFDEDGRPPWDDGYEGNVNAERAAPTTALGQVTSHGEEKTKASRLKRL